MPNYNESKKQILSRKKKLIEEEPELELVPALEFYKEYPLSGKDKKTLKDWDVGYSKTLPDRTNALTLHKEKTILLNKDRYEDPEVSESFKANVKTHELGHAVETYVYPRNFNLSERLAAEVRAELVSWKYHKDLAGLGGFFIYLLSIIEEYGNLYPLEEAIKLIKYQFRRYKVPSIWYSVLRDVIKENLEYF